MTVIVLLLIAVLAFMGGFLFGAIYSPQSSLTESRKPDCQVEIIAKEYENFLNYDGSEQI